MKKESTYIVKLLIIALGVIACTQKQSSQKMETSSLDFYVGTYTSNTKSEGIYKYSLTSKGFLKAKGCAAPSENPSFLTKTKDGKFLLAVNENNPGTVTSFNIKEDTLIAINKRESGGVHPCFIATHKDGSVLVANYSSGSIGYLTVNKEGKLSEIVDIQNHKGIGTHPRQEAPHAHSVWFNPYNQDIISVDLGTNALLFSKIDPVTNTLTPLSQKQLLMKDAAGPRHLAFHPKNEWIYVINELNASISLVTHTDNKYHLKNSISTLPDNYNGDNTCADIHISNDGNFLYASNRGHDSIAIFSIAADGSLTLIGHQSTQGKGPRNFAISPDDQYLVVANQYTDNLISFERSKETGLLRFVSEIEAPTPVCILF